MSVASKKFEDLSPDCQEVALRMHKYHKKLANLLLEAMITITVSEQATGINLLDECSEELKTWWEETLKECWPDIAPENVRCPL